MNLPTSLEREDSYRSWKDLIQEIIDYEITIKEFDKFFEFFLRDDEIPSDKITTAFTIVSVKPFANPKTNYYFFCGLLFEAIK
jgi:hypothetical protein